MAKLRPPFKCHGGKYYLAPWIISQFPANYPVLNYVEPFCGGASVFFNKQPAIGGAKEVLADLDAGVIAVLWAIRTQLPKFREKLRKLKYSERVFTTTRDAHARRPKDPESLATAVGEYVCRRMSRGGLQKAFAWSERLRGGQPGDLNAWLTALDNLDQLSARLQDVYKIVNVSALRAIDAYDSARTLLYLDPPYVHSTRASTNAYAYEMDEEAHTKLAERVRKFKGRVLISGYPSPLYRKLFKGWHMSSRQIVNHSSQTKVKELKTEVLWRNFT